MSEIVLGVNDDFRQGLLAEHAFYVEQAKARLLSQFDRMKEESEEAAKAYFERVSCFFPPDWDFGDFNQAAEDKGIEFYGLLFDMRNRTRLGVVAGMFHLWDINLREWLVSQTRRFSHGKNIHKAIWKAKFGEITELLAVLGWDFSAMEWFKLLDAMRLVVNVFKHGDGNSLDDLKANYPEYLYSESTTMRDFFRVPVELMDHSALEVSDEHIDRFSGAISGFWQALPSFMALDSLSATPGWFANAYTKDQGEVA